MKVDKVSRRTPLRRLESNIVLIDSRTLERECFVRGVGVVEPKTRIVAYANVSGWDEAGCSASNVSAVLYNVEGRRIAEADVRAQIARTKEMAFPTPVFVLSPFEDLSEMFAALDCGASGFIPASLGIEAVLIAIRLGSASGIFLPATSVQALRDAVAATRGIPNVPSQFTPRQAAVAEALRRGKSNKLIAYELNMCESTVKVHIQNIMKKLGAKNRTEAGFKLSASLMRKSSEVTLEPPV